ncbi:PAS domain S-box-containing protein [Pedobacter sp. CG_S7]|uniref:PAS domain-containing protein n=1 Tax=Pedobacter sp. CG_S7 TaxID=3143930 RepID=UPI0033934E75
MQNFENAKKLLNNSSIYYLIAVDMNSNYLYINKRYQNSFNVISSQLVGQHYAVTVHPDDLEICHSVSAKCFQNPSHVFPAIIRKHDGNGGYIITQWEYRAMFDDNNLPAGMLCIGNDITEFMQTSIDLETAKKSLNDAELTLNQLFYLQSHVFRKPVANIIGLTLILDSMEIDATIKSIFSMVNQSAKELDEVIKKIAEKV